MLLENYELVVVQVPVSNGGERRRLDKAEHGLIYAKDVYLSRCVNVRGGQAAAHLFASRGAPSAIPAGRHGRSVAALTLFA